MVLLEVSRKRSGKESSRGLRGAPFFALRLLPFFVCSLCSFHKASTFTTLFAPRPNAAAPKPLVFFALSLPSAPKLKKRREENCPRQAGQEREFAATAAPFSLFSILMVFLRTRALKLLLFLTSSLLPFLSFLPLLRECQLGDWKAHKKVCDPKLKADFPDSNASGNLLTGTLQKNYIGIMTEVAKVASAKGVRKRDIVVILDFYSEGGVIPALAGKFEVEAVRDFFGSAKEPDWFCKGTDFYDKNVRSFKASLEEHGSKMNGNQLLTTMRQTDSQIMSHKVMLMGGGDAKRHIFSDEAFALFPIDGAEKRSAVERLIGKKIAMP